MWNKVQIAIEQQKPKESCFQELEHNEYNKYEVKVNLFESSLQSYMSLVY